MKASILICLATIAGTLGIQAANLTWDADTGTTEAQDGAGTWNTVINSWWDGTANVTWNNDPPDNAIFGAGNGAAGTVTVVSSTIITVSNITFNAAGSGGYNIAAGNTASRINLSGTPTITVASGVFATNLVIVSGTSFTKMGAGTLVLKPSNPYVNTGPTVVGEGTVIIGSSAGRVLIPGDLTITNGATALLGADQQIADSAIVTVDGGIFDSGGKNETVSGFILANNGQVLSASSSKWITNNGAIFDLRSGVFFPNLSGTAGLTKTTSGTVVITNGSGVNTFSGPVLVNEGVLDLGHSSSGGNFALPGTTITITNTGMIRLGKDNQIKTTATVIVAGGTYELMAHNDTITTVVLDSNGSILNGGSQSKTLTVLNNMDFRSGLCTSVLGGGGAMTKTTPGTVILTMNNGYSGGTTISDGVVQLGDGSTTNRGQFGPGPVINDGRIVLNHFGSFTIANSISGTGSLTNLGGTASITGDNTYAGGTTVSGGTLAVNNGSGSGTGSGTVQVQSGATLAGTGMVGGRVIIQFGGNLAPGHGGIGTLSVNSLLTLSAGSISTFQVDGTTPANDAIIAGASVTYGGVLNIEISGTFTVGQQFVLFSGTGATDASNFASIVGSPGAGLGFTFTNGVLSVISTGSPQPTLNFSQSGNTLTFSWSEAGFKLQSQTNSLAVGLSNNWFDYSDVANPVNVQMNPANETVFFRLAPQ